MVFFRDFLGFCFFLALLDVGNIRLPDMILCFCGVCVVWSNKFILNYARNMGSGSKKSDF